MVSDILRSDIDRYVSEFRASNRLLGAARSGRVTPSVVVRYLTSLRYLLGLTPAHLSIAGARAAALGHTGLASYFAGKVEEEVGHDQWAEADARRIAAVFGAEPPSGPAATILALVRRTRDAIEHDPFSYIAYILFAEYFTVTVGPEWMTALVENCGIPMAALTVVSRHVELDGEHAAEGCREIDALVEEQSLPSLRAMLRDTMQGFSAFCDELCEAAA